MYEHLSNAWGSDIGQKRSNNEDSVMVFPPNGIYCVADGMGGPGGGEVASKLVISCVQEVVEQIDSGNYHQTVAYKTIMMQRAIDLANERIRIKADEILKKGMGSTVVMLAFDGCYPTRACAFHAGDSRCYRLRGHHFERITTDHSIMSELGMKNEKKMPRMFRGIVTRAVGIKQKVRMEVTPVEVETGDVFLLCSDGLTGMVNDKEIKRILTSKKDNALEQLKDRLIKAANDGGGKDNISVVLVKTGELPAPIEVNDYPDYPDEMMTHDKNAVSWSDEMMAAEAATSMTTGDSSEAVTTGGQPLPLDDETPSEDGSMIEEPISADRLEEISDEDDEDELYTPVSVDDHSYTHDSDSSEHSEGFFTADSIEGHLPEGWDVAVDQPAETAAPPDTPAPAVPAAPAVTADKQPGPQKRTVKPTRSTRKSYMAQKMYVMVMSLIVAIVIGAVLFMRQGSNQGRTVPPDKTPDTTTVKVTARRIYLPLHRLPEDPPVKVGYRVHPQDNWIFVTNESFRLPFGMFEFGYLRPDYDTISLMEKVAEIEETMIVSLPEQFTPKPHLDRLLRLKEAWAKQDWENVEKIIDEPTGGIFEYDSFRDDWIRLNHEWETVKTAKQKLEPFMQASTADGQLLNRLKKFTGILREMDQETRKLELLRPVIDAICQRYKVSVLQTITMSSPDADTLWAWISQDSPRALLNCTPDEWAQWQVLRQSSQALAQQTPDKTPKPPEKKPEQPEKPPEQPPEKTPVVAVALASPWPSDIALRWRKGEGSWRRLRNTVQLEPDRYSFKFSRPDYEDLSIDLEVKGEQQNIPVPREQDWQPSAALTALRRAEKATGSEQWDTLKSLMEKSEWTHELQAAEHKRQAQKVRDTWKKHLASLQKTEPPEQPPEQQPSTGTGLLSLIKPDLSQVPLTDAGQDNPPEQAHVEQPPATVDAVAQPAQSKPDKPSDLAAKMETAEKDGRWDIVARYIQQNGGFRDFNFKDNAEKQRCIAWLKVWEEAEKEGSVKKLMKKYRNDLIALYEALELVGEPALAFERDDDPAAYCRFLNNCNRSLDIHFNKRLEAIQQGSEMFADKESPILKGLKKYLEMTGTSGEFKAISSAFKQLETDSKYFMDWKNEKWQGPLSYAALKSFPIKETAKMQEQFEIAWHRIIDLLLDDRIRRQKANYELLPEIMEDDNLYQCLQDIITLQGGLRQSISQQVRDRTFDFHKWVEQTGQKDALALLNKFNELLKMEQKIRK